MNDPQPQCACAKFQRLEGAATQAYITQFLHKTAAESRYYQCRECSVKWEKVEAANRPSLRQITADEAEENT